MNKHIRQQYPRYYVQMTLIRTAEVAVGACELRHTVVVMEAYVAVYPVSYTHLTLPTIVGV